MDRRTAGARGFIREVPTGHVEDAGLGVKPPLPLHEQQPFLESGRHGAVSIAGAHIIPRRPRHLRCGAGAREFRGTVYPVDALPRIRRTRQERRAREASSPGGCAGGMGMGMGTGTATLLRGVICD